MAELAQYLQALGARPGMAIPAPDEHGFYRLRFAGGLVVALRQVRDKVQLQGKVCHLPEDENAAEALCRKLLQLALGRTLQECGKQLPHLEVSGNQVLLVLESPVFAHDEECMQCLEEFLNLLEKWSDLAGSGQVRPTSLPFADFNLIRP